MLTREGGSMPLQGSDETRGRILDAAMQQFSAEGYLAASVDDICMRARVSKGAFYYHFESKRALFLALLEDWLGGLEKSMESMRKPTVPETLMQMAELMPMVMATAQGRLNMWLEFWLQASRDKKIWKATIAPYRHYRDLFSEMIRQGTIEGTVKVGDPDAAAQAILSMAVGLLLQSTLDPKGADWRKVTAQSMQILVTGLTPGTRAADGGRK
jgi:AcrR family transcriptional regulator